MDDFFASILLLGALSGSPEMPFWATANQFGTMPQSSGGLLLAKAGNSFDEARDFQWRWGVSAGANAEGTADYNLLVDELYGSLKWKKATLDIGIKHRDKDFLASDDFLGSLSVTSGHFIETGNAPSLPGYLLSLDPVVIPKTKGKLSISGAYGDFMAVDGRDNGNVLMHRLRGYLNYDISKRLRFTAGIDHFVLWGGEEMSVNLENYLRMLVAAHAGDDGNESDRINAIGNHGGAESLRLDYSADKFILSFLYDKPYEDGSGVGYQNFPDGDYSLYLGFRDRNRWISDVMCEYQYTMWQSGPYHDKDGVIYGGVDAYFNNGARGYGWTNAGYTIGNPLFFINKSGDGVENNRLKAFHFALSGSLFHKLPYKLMLTSSMNYGLYQVPYKGESQWEHEWGTIDETPLVQFSAAFTGVIPSLFKVSGLSAVYGIYFDRGEVFENSTAITFGIRYNCLKVKK